MPSTNKTITATGSSFNEEVSIIAEHGVLQGLTFGPPEPGTGLASTYVQVFVASNETPTPVNLALLCSGYVGANNNIGWTGKIKLSPTFSVRAIFRTEDTPVLRLAIVTDRKLPENKSI